MTCALCLKDRPATHFDEWTMTVHSGPSERVIYKKHRVCNGCIGKSQSKTWDTRRELIFFLNLPEPKQRIYLTTMWDRRKWGSIDPYLLRHELKKLGHLKEGDA